MNLILSFPMRLPATESGVLANFVEEAGRWQNPVRPSILEFNHGEYMHRHGDPIAYLAAELKKKLTSNRAVISLVDTEPIFRSGDGPLPSFLLLQAGFDERRRDVLCITAYYRALEVSRFLPMNITEIALIAERLADEMPLFAEVEITMHAFRAHSVPGNSGHERSRLDLASATQIHDLVEKRDYKKIAELLRNKAAPASIIVSSGLTTLRLEVEGAGWPEPVLTELDRGVAALDRLRIVRVNGTHGASPDGVQRQVTESLHAAADLVEQLAKGAR